MQVQQAPNDRGAVLQLSKWVMTLADEPLANKHMTKSTSNLNNYLNFHLPSLYSTFSNTCLQSSTIFAGEEENAMAIFNLLNL